MKVHSHQYSKVERGAIVDGAILMHEEMSDLLRASGALVEHDVTTGPRCLRGVKDGDVIYAGIGPYAYLYHRWRAAAGVDCRILREVHTSFWSGYWAQEELCAGQLRPGDVALFPTEYARRLYAWTPYASSGGTVVAYPQLDRLARLPQRPVRRGGVRVGYLGALSKAKNFDQVLRVFQRVHSADSRSRLVFAGKANNADFSADNIQAWIASSGIDADAVTDRGIVSREALTSFFQEIDLLLFPSTASRETLGRVVLEALAQGVPVLAADIGPAVELLPQQNLIPTRLLTGVGFTMDRSVALGVIDEEVAAHKILDGDCAPAAILNPAPYRDDRWWEHVQGRPSPDGEIEVYDRTLADAVRVAERPTPAGEAEAQAAEELFACYFQGRRDEIVRRLDSAEVDAEARPRLQAVATQAASNLADYRAFPTLIDALVLRPLQYSLSEPTVTGAETRQGSREPASRRPEFY